MKDLVSLSAIIAVIITSKYIWRNKCEINKTFELAKTLLIDEALEAGPAQSFTRPWQIP